MRIGMMVDSYKPYVSGITNYVDINKRYFEMAGHEVFVFTFGDLVINGITRSVSLHERFIHTTPTEFRLLNVMCTNPGSVFTREELVDLLTQNEGSALESNDLVSHSNLRTVDSHVRSLRKKIGADYIRTVHAVGYSFEPNLGKSQESA
jgi:DNA-binding response OmpR family regulator